MWTQKSSCSKLVDKEKPSGMEEGFLRGLTDHDSSPRRNIWMEENIEFSPAGLCADTNNVTD